MIDDEAIRGTGGNDTKQRNEKRIGCGLRLGLGFCVLLIFFILDLIRTPNTSTSTRRRTGRRRRRREINEKKKRQRIVRGFERPYCPSVVFFFSRWTISGSGGGKRACCLRGKIRMDSAFTSFNFLQLLFLPLSFLLLSFFFLEKVYSVVYWLSLLLFPSSSIRDRNLSMWVCDPVVVVQVRANFKLFTVLYFFSFFFFCFKLVSQQYVHGYGNSYINKNRQTARLRLRQWTKNHDSIA